MDRPIGSTLRTSALFRYKSLMNANAARLVVAPEFMLAWNHPRAPEDAIGTVFQERDL
jgi:hypothetical protein